MAQSKNADIQMENSLLKQPLEFLSRSGKTSQKLIEKEVSGVSVALSALCNQLPVEGNSSAANRQRVKDELGRLVGRLQGLKRKLEAADAKEDAAVCRLELRLGSLRAVAGDDEPTDAVSAAAAAAIRRNWGRRRVDRLLVDHLGREGRLETAAALARDVADFVDMDAFEEGRGAAEALARHDAGPALAWCQENRARLRRLDSTLELRLRVQELMELARAGDTEAAIAYARKHLAPAGAAGLAEVKRCMAALALGPETVFPAYRRMYHPQRWQDLITAFKQEVYEVHSLPSRAPLLVALQAGLACLKCAACAEGAEANVNCPTCHPTLRRLAEPLPPAHHMLSRLLCRISGRPMDESDPPYVLPNGSVYSYKALAAMAEANDGLVTDPATLQDFLIADARKAYVS